MNILYVYYTICSVCVFFFLNTFNIPIRKKGKEKKKRVDKSPKAC